MKDPPTPSSDDSPRRRPGLALELLPARFAVCRLDGGAAVPPWATGGSFTSISRSADELSIVCEEERAPAEVRAERGWRAIKVLGPADDQGPLDFALIGVLEALARPLTAARVSLFTVSTYDTDYLLVRAANFGRARQALTGAGHRFVGAAAPAEAPAARPAPGPVEEPAADEERDDADTAATVEPKTPAAATEPPPDRAGGVAAPPEAPRDSAPERGRRRGGHRRDADGDRESDDEADSTGLFTGAIPQHPVETTDDSFDTLGLSPAILVTVAECGFVHPTPIQSGVIPRALAGQDVIGLAQTGSGKTAAFVLPLAEKLTHGRGTRALILSPTREIALQTKAFLDLFGRDHELETACLIGGVRLGPQIDALRRTPDILVATPGRLLDHVERRNVRLDRIEELVLDEADHMLDLGFLPQIRDILGRLPERRRTMMFSATMPPAIERLAQLYMEEPVTVDFRPAGHAAEGIEHRLYLVKEDDRRACLLALLTEVEGSTLIFVRRKIEAEWLANQLEKEGYEVERIHSDRSQQQRVQALKGFKEGGHRVLVATDVAARGLDIPVIRHVVNFGLPETVEDYIHRAGRTARGAAGGIVSTIGTWLDKPMVRDIEELIGEPLTRSTVGGVEPYVELKPRRKTLRRRLL